MEGVEPTLKAEILLGHAEFLHALARHLVHDRAEAEDLVQETYAAALKAPPQDLSRPLRPWLSQVLRNAFRSAGRAGSRRRSRERARVAAEASSATPGVDEVLARAELHREIVELLTTLEEPYRGALLLRFYEGRDASEIGRAMHVPAGTIRWRISEGLKRLRQRLDEKHAGGRQAWRALLLPIIPDRSRINAPAVAAGGAGPGAGTIAGVAGAMVVVGAAVWWLAAAPGPPDPSVASPGGPAREITTPRNQQNNQPEDRAMSSKGLKTVTVLFGVAIPALVAGAEKQADSALREAAISGCVTLREKVFECDAAFAELFIKDAPPERRNALRGKALEEIANDGAGPIEPRRQKCAAVIDKSPAPTSKEQIAGFENAINGCWSKGDCKERADCLWPIMQRLKGKK